MDAKGNVIEKAFLIYDKRGMKIQRKAVDGKGTLISDKKYIYEY